MARSKTHGLAPILIALGVCASLPAFRADAGPAAAAGHAVTPAAKSNTELARLQHPRAGHAGQASTDSAFHGGHGGSQSAGYWSSYASSTGEGRDRCAAEDPASPHVSTHGVSDGCGGAGSCSGYRASPFAARDNRTMRRMAPTRHDTELAMCRYGIADIHMPDAEPAPLHRLAYRVRSGDSWPEIARMHAVTQEQLQAWNPEVPIGLAPGTDLTLWVPPGFEPQPVTDLGHDRDRSGLGLRPVPPDAVSRGHCSGGRLLRGAQLPENPDLYLIRRPEFAYGSTHALENLQLGLAKFRATSPYAGPLVVSDMSKRRGGRLPPHHSHQSGRDVDIWLPLKREVIAERGMVPVQIELAAMNPDVWDLAAKAAHQVDWPATLALVKALIRTGEIRYIFLSRSRQRHLYRAARAEGLSPEELEGVIEYPHHRTPAIVRHAPHHRKHMHVRFRCARDERHCI